MTDLIPADVIPADLRPADRADGAVPEAAHPAGPATTGQPALDAVLEALRLAALRMLASAPHLPHRLRLEAAGVAVQLDWPSAPPPLEAHAPRAMANPLPDHGFDHPRANGNARTDNPVPLPEPDLHSICAPTVGTFYRAPEPGAKPFVAVGDLVVPGQQLAIVEAMKLMIPVEADRAGRIREILATDATAVEYGERLITIVPA
ncbi:MAG TPA: biotin/lipoyl-containing protein [Rugosimonospora sp.]|nr:biotin/lipoyl-containing protein [Rugosimonospora sp.]